MCQKVRPKCPHFPKMSSLPRSKTQIGSHNDSHTSTHTHTHTYTLLGRYWGSTRLSRPMSLWWHKVEQRFSTLKGLYVLLFLSLVWRKVEVGVILALKKIIFLKPVDCYQTVMLPSVHTYSSAQYKTCFLITVSEILDGKVVVCTKWSQSCFRL